MYLASTTLICVRHIRQNIERYLIDNGYPLKFRSKIINDLFSENVGVINQTDDIFSVLQDLYHTWDEYEHQNNIIKKISFSNWFKKHQEARFLQNCLHEVKKLGFNRVFRNNRQEAIHHAIKQYLGKKCHIIEFVKKLNDIVTGQQLERIRATQQVGEYRIKDAFKAYTPRNDDDIPKFLSFNPSTEAKGTGNTGSELTPSKVYDNLTKLFKLPMNAGKKKSDIRKPTKSKATFTEIYHNDRPFFIELMSKNSNKCASCKIDFASKIEKPPFNLVLRHSERWSFTCKETNTVVNTNKYCNAYYHFDMHCIHSRFPYFTNALLRISVIEKSKLTTSHYKHIRNEFDADLT